ncbi:MAG: GNAT family N-acetyltransferase [Bacteroidales bacterium]|nr:GNAT family N-acetyltransferase [Bacteroidales bacterium]
MNSFLESPLIRLRAMEPRDIDQLYIWENDPEVWIVSNTRQPYSKFTFREYINNAGKDIYATRQLRLMIDDKMGHTVGTIDIFDFEPFHLRAGLGILIAKDFRGNGYAEEAVRCVCHYLFVAYKIHSIYSNVMADNIISLKLFQHIGFELQGTKKDWIRTKDGFTDVHFLQLTHDPQE